MRRWCYTLCNIAGFFLLAPFAPSYSQEAAEDEDSPEILEEVEDVDEALDEVLVDVQGSIEDADTGVGLSFDGDLRAGYLFAGDGFSDFEFASTVFRAASGS